MNKAKGSRTKVSLLLKESLSEYKGIQAPRPPLLVIEGLRIAFNDGGRSKFVLDGVDLQLDPEEGIAVIGESGSGKTLTMMSVLGLVPPKPGVVAGRIRYFWEDTDVSLLDGIDEAFEPVFGESSEESSFEPVDSYVPTGKFDRWYLNYRRKARLLAGRHIGIIFQNPISSLDPFWSVGDTLIESIRIRDPKLSRKEAREEAMVWLERVHIKNPPAIMRSYPHQLSGGMCQRVMIAATLALRPKIIIADEPTTGLDMTTKAQILYLLYEARTKYKSSLIFVTHDLGLVTGLTERVYVMNKGRVVDEFPTEVLSEVSLKGRKLEAEFPFADYTKQLLEASLILEEG